MSAPQGATYFQRQSVPQLIEAVNKEDDWTGVTSAEVRRKRQNRLNVRAYRRRRKAQALQVCTSEDTSSGADTPNPEAAIPYWVEDEQGVVFFPALVAQKLRTSGPPLIPSTFRDVVPVIRDRSTAARVMFPLSPDHLITLLQYNVLRACIANRYLFSSCYGTPSSPECSAAELYVLPNLPLPDSLPPALHATALQRTIPHEMWLDIIPHPVWRDNLLRAMGTFDEDELWADTIGGLFDGFPDSEVERRGVIAWSPPWHVSGWEISEGFLRKWAWAFKGCQDALDATNKWRQLRGDEPLTINLSEFS